MKNETKALNPGRILDMGFGFFASQALITAIQIGVFTCLGKGEKASTELRRELDLHGRGALDFLDALVALGLLSKRRICDQVFYRNTEESTRYLDRSSEEYVGGIFTMSGNRLYRSWSYLGDALRTGQPQSEAKNSDKPLFDEIFTDQKLVREFCAAMSGLSRHNFDVFTDSFPFDRFERHVDLGASTGLLSKFAVTKYPNLKSIAFDLPQVAAVTRECVENWQLSHRIEVVPGSFFTDPLPRGDLITLGLILHDWNLEKKLDILRRAYEALSPGGALVVIENLIDDERRENAFGLLMSLNMLIEFGDGFDYSFEEFSSWCSQIGFKRCEKMHIFGSCSAGVAYK